MSKLPLRVATGTPSRIETADGWNFGIEWKDTSAANPYGEAEAFAAFIVRAVNSHETLVSALAGMLDSFGGYSSHEVDAAITVMQELGCDRWSMQAQMDAEAKTAIEVKAKELYDGFAYDEPGEKPAWVPGGNSLKQQEARGLARAALSSASKPGER